MYLPEVLRFVKPLVFGLSKTDHDVNVIHVTMTLCFHVKREKSYHVNSTPADLAACYHTSSSFVDMELEIMFPLKENMYFHHSHNALDRSYAL